VLSTQGGGSDWILCKPLNIKDANVTLRTNASVTENLKTGHGYTSIKIPKRTPKGNYTAECLVKNSDGNFTKSISFTVPSK